MCIPHAYEIVNNNRAGKKYEKAKLLGCSNAE